MAIGSGDNKKDNAGKLIVAGVSAVLVTAGALVVFTIGGKTIGKDSVFTSNPLEATDAWLIKANDIIEEIPQAVGHFVKNPTTGVFVWVGIVGLSAAAMGLLYLAWNRHRHRNGMGFRLKDFAVPPPPELSSGSGGGDRLPGARKTRPFTDLRL